MLESSSAWLTPLREQCAVAQLCDGRRCEEDLIPGKKGDLPIELSTSSATQRGAEDTSVDNQPHERSAAANASSSASVRSSISRTSAVASVGAAVNSSADRSRGSNDVPCGTPRRPSAALLMVRFYVRDARPNAMTSRDTPSGPNHARRNVTSDRITGRAIRVLRAPRERLHANGSARTRLSGTRPGSAVAALASKRLALESCAYVLWRFRGTAIVRTREEPPDPLDQGLHHRSQP